MSENILRAVRAEIDDLHEFFVDWFAGRLPESHFERRFLAHLEPSFVLVPPSGVPIAFDELRRGIQASYGSNPDFRIAIREVRIRQQGSDFVLATYEEWQRNASASSPADNGRISTVLLRRAELLRWLHVHETWLPEAAMSAGPYDF